MLYSSLLLFLQFFGRCILRLSSGISCTGLPIRVGKLHPPPDRFCWNWELNRSLKLYYRPHSMVLLNELSCNICLKSSLPLFFKIDQKNPLSIIFLFFFSKILASELFILTSKWQITAGRLTFSPCDFLYGALNFTRKITFLKFGLFRFFHSYSLKLSLIHNHIHKQWSCAMFLEFLNFPRR